MRSNLWKRAGLVAWVFGCFAFGAFATGQVTIPYTFVAGTRAEPSEVNANFSTLGTQALNRTSGTMIGPMVFSPDNTYDIGASGATRPRDFFLGRDLAVGRNATVAGTLGVTGNTTLAGALGVTGDTTLTGNLGVLNWLTVSGVIQGLGLTHSASLHVGGATDPGDNNLLVDGEAQVVGNLDVNNWLTVDGTVQALGLTHTASLHVGGTSDPGNDNLAVDGVAYHSAGTNLAPSVTFTGDTNTGLANTFPDELDIVAGGEYVAAALVNAFQVIKGLTAEASVTLNNLGTATVGTDLVLTAGNVMRPKSSSRRYKEHERPWAGDARELLALRAKTFDYKGDDGAKGVLGFIAEDVAAVNPIYVNTNATGQPESLRADSIMAALVTLVQQQDGRIRDLEARPTSGTTSPLLLGLIAALGLAAGFAYARRF